jgi:hypothetical protein
MFGIFKTATFEDGRLGVLTRSRGCWRGSITLGQHGMVELNLSGGRESPDAEGLALAHELPARYEALCPAIQASLFEHYEPYREEADSAGEHTELFELVSKIQHAEDVWPHVVAQWVRIESLQGAPQDGPTIEIAYRVAWDEEHTVGARIQDWRLWELCGSVV